MKRLSYFIFLLALTACNKEEIADASGTFEAIETIISAETSGTIEELNIVEGQNLQQGQAVGFIDTVTTYLQTKEIEAQIASTYSKRPNITTQLGALNEQLRKARTERQRIANLLQGGAATSKQLDDADAEIDYIQRQIAAQKSSLEISSEGINNDAEALKVRLEQLKEQLKKGKIINPVEGTVLTKYAEEKEEATPGKPLYKIANLKEIILRAYVTGNQLPGIKINQHVRVLTDNGKGGFKETTGKIIWISDKAEFTPKTIQTKEERANLVYAIKVRVSNDGSYKIGMYGEIALSNERD